MLFTPIFSQATETIPDPDFRKISRDCNLVFDQDVYTRGKAVYQTNCTACHNGDPKKPGAVGPELAGSSRELIEARVLRAEYPPGYKPKRQTHLMVPLPQLKPEIDALAEYLNYFNFSNQRK